MNKSIFLIYVFLLVILMSPLTFPHNFVSLIAEAQRQSSDITGGSSNNVTDLLKSNSQNSSTPLENKTVNYFGNASGYLVYPASSSPSSIKNNNTTANNNTFPAVVMIHENKGLNDNIKNMANLLAKEGYVILAVDLFNGEVTTDQKRASELTQSIRDNPDAAITNLKSAVKYLASLPNVNPEKIASLGWCFGGQQSLQLALNSEEHPLAATVIY